MLPLEPLRGSVTFRATLGSQGVSSRGCFTCHSLLLPVRILLYYCYICVRMLLYICVLEFAPLLHLPFASAPGPHTTLLLLHMCPHAATTTLCPHMSWRACVYLQFDSVLVVYMCSHATTVYVSRARSPLSLSLALSLSLSLSLAHTLILLQLAEVRCVTCVVDVCNAAN